MLSQSKRANLFIQSEIRAMTIECERMGGINLAQGVCDTEVPIQVRRAAQVAIDAGVNSYTRFDGLHELRQAIARKMFQYNGITANPETDIVVSAGSTGAFYCACLALLDPGDEVVLFEPYYGYHLNTLLAVQATPSFVTTVPPHWTFAAEELEKAISPRTKGIMVSTPANPSGKVFTQKELEVIAEAALRHDLFIFTDEIYEYFIYDGRQHISPGSISEIANRTITISGFSKVFSITGWRIGYSISHARWAQIIGYVNDLVYVCAPAPLQMGVARGMAELSPEYYIGLLAEYAEKRDRICCALEKACLKPYVPQGAYYVLADVSWLPGANSKEKATYLLSKVGVAGVPGEAFYHDRNGTNLVRFCFAKTDADLDKACRRIEGFA